MKKIALFVVGCAVVLSAALAIASMKVSKHAHLASRWIESIEAAKPLAKEKKLPILHLQMFGRLEDEFC